MNELVASKSGGALAAVNALRGNLKKAQMQMPETQGSQYLRFLQDGNWVFGQENEEVLPSDMAAINPMSLKTGWSCWTDRPGKGAKNENLGEHMVALGGDAVGKHELPEKRDPKNGDKACDWREQVSIDVKFLSGPHKGKQVHYKTTSLGGINALHALIDQIKLQLDEDPENIVPVVSLDGDHYNHKSYGRTYTPVIRIKSWVSIDGDEAAAGEIVGAPPKTEEKKPEPEAAPKRSRTRAVEPEPEQEDEQEPDADEPKAVDEQIAGGEAPRRRRR